MIVLIGIKKNTPINIREKYSIKNKDINRVLEKLNEKFKEAIIINTCNRVEIYINCDKKLVKEKIINKVLYATNWNEEYKEYLFISYEESCYKHILELSCGFHSKIVGEDQIIGQIREAYERSRELKFISRELMHLFERALACGKEFRNEAKLYEIPVSSASIAINDIVASGGKAVMIIGFGEIGKLVYYGLKSKKVEEIIVVVRDKSKIEKLSHGKVINYEEKNKYIDNVDGIISCTSAPHIVLKKEEVPKKGRNLLVYDLAMPRDVDEEISYYERVKLYNIDDVSRLDDENKELRKERMKAHKYLVKEYLEDFMTWMSTREVAPLISDIIKNSESIWDKRANTYKNKTNGENEELVNILLKSTSDYYVHRGIEVLKEEILEGNGEECIRIMKKIFLKKR